jgi:hypothetical protein
MSVPIRTFVLLGVAVGMLGAGYVFVPRPGAAAISTAPAPTAVTAPASPAIAKAEPAAPTAKPSTTLVVNRAPTPLQARTHTNYYQPTPGEAAEATASTPATAQQAPGFQTAALTAGAATNGGLPPPDATANAEPKESDAKAKAAVELDGYRNVRGLEKGPDGIWRGRAMRGRTEIAIRVDATGNVSAD